MVSNSGSPGSFPRIGFFSTEVILLCAAIGGCCARLSPRSAFMEGLEFNGKGSYKSKCTKRHFLSLSLEMTWMILCRKFNLLD